MGIILALVRHRRVAMLHVLFKQGNDMEPTTRWVSQARASRRNTQKREEDPETALGHMSKVVDDW